MITDEHKREWIYNLSNLPVRGYPFPHAILAGTIPPELYALMLSNMPLHEDFVPLHTTGRIGAGAYPQRFIYDDDDHFWFRVKEFILTPSFGLALARPFGKLKAGSWKMDTLLIEDLPGYRIGPHADASHKVLSALFYLWNGPPHDSLVDAEKWGTSIYTPSERTLADLDLGRSEVNPNSGRHYEFEQFDRIATVPYLPNHGLLFVKGDHSWHGVPEIPAIPGERRIILLADIKLTA